MRACVGINRIPITVILWSRDMALREAVLICTLGAMLNPGCPSVLAPVLRPRDSCLHICLVGPTGSSFRPGPGQTALWICRAWMRSLPWERLGKCPLCTGGSCTLASRTGFLPWLCGPRIWMLQLVWEINCFPYTIQRAEGWCSHCLILSIVGVLIFLQIPGLFLDLLNQNL